MTLRLNLRQIQAMFLGTKKYAVLSLALSGVCVLGAIALFSPLTTSFAKAAAQKPNIIFIIADDLGYGEISAYKKDWVPTPNIDSLGKSGMRFTDGHVSAAVCAPSRAGFNTGRSGVRHGSEYNAGDGVNQDEKTVGEMLKQAGYATAAIGKWHMGLKEGRHPLEQGYDEFFGMNSGSLYIAINDPEAVNGFGVSADADLKTGQRLRPIFRGRKPVEEKEYLTEAFTREALDFIDRNKNSKNPFFIYLAYNAPHAPIQTTQKYYDRFPNIKDKNSRIHAAMVSALDDGVGEILKKLKDEGLDKNTMVVFISDNGCPETFNGSCSNAELNGWKRYHLEGGHRIPFFISWPGHVPVGVVYKNPVSALDLYPTFAAIAGGQLPQDRVIDGVDLMPYMTSANKDMPHPELYWRSGGSFAVREGKWKLVVANKTPVTEFLNIKQSEEGGLLAHPPYAGVSPLGQHVMLYDLENDLEEKHNLASQHPDIVAGLRKKFEEWNKDNVPSNAKSSRAFPTVIDGEVVELAF